jgi:type II secretory pathway component PulF
MTTTSQEVRQAFAYRAQGADGGPVTGTIDAADADEARLRLASLGLRVFQLEAAAPPPKPARLGAEDFAAFNRQLAQLTAAGMPIEAGLRLIAQDMRSQRLGRAVEAVAEDLERGDSLPEAFGRRSAHFPALYGRVLEAGIAAGNLPGVLLNLGRHLELMQRLRRNLWRAASYPIMSLVALCGVMFFIGYVVAGPVLEIYQDLDQMLKLPWITRALFAVAHQMPLVLIVIAAHVIGLMLVWRWSQVRGYEQRFIDRYVAWMPLIGRVIRANLVARWTGALGLGVEAGLDLPRAVDLAGAASGSLVLVRDGQRILAAHEAGEPLQSAGPVYLVPPTVLAAMELGRKRGDLPQVLRTLSQMYAQQSEHHLATVVAVLSPMMLIFVAALLALVIAALFMPVTRLLQAISG